MNPAAGAYLRVVVASGVGQIDDQTKLLLLLLQTVQQLLKTKDIRVRQLTGQSLKENTLALSQNHPQKRGVKKWKMG